MIDLYVFTLYLNIYPGSTCRCLSLPRLRLFYFRLQRLVLVRHQGRIVRVQGALLVVAFSSFRGQCPPVAPTASPSGQRVPGIGVARQTGGGGGGGACGLLCLLLQLLLELLLHDLRVVRHRRHLGGRPASRLLLLLLLLLLRWWRWGWWRRSCRGIYCRQRIWCCGCLCGFHQMVLRHNCSVITSRCPARSSRNAIKTKVKAKHSASCPGLYTLD